MRQTLIRLVLETPWSGWQAVPGDVPHIGICWAWLLISALLLVYYLLSGQKEALKSRETWLTMGIGLLALSLAHRFLPVPATLPVFGYGMMVLLGFACGFAFAWSRAKSIGINPDLVVDVAFWLLVSGVVGGRLAFLVQYWDHVFRPGMSLPQALFSAINLSEGGLVLIGALAGGALGLLGFCYSRRQNFTQTAELADLLIPSVFIGVGFGRLGCLLNGCCFGDRCDLPWAIQFPAGSTTFNILVDRGFVSPDALATFPLHPTQIYSSIDGFLLAFVTAVYYWYRKHPGDGLALGCMLYSITRFLIEFLRSDEMGQLGTGLTISQLYSIGIFLFGVILLLTGPRRGPARRPVSIPSPAMLPDSEIGSLSEKSKKD